MKFIYFQGKNNQWYWKLVARNGRSIAISGEGYKRRRGCLKAIDSIKKELGELDVRVEEGK